MMRNQQEQEQQHFEEERPEGRSIALHQAFQPTTTLPARPSSFPAAPFNFRTSRINNNQKQQQQQKNNTSVMTNNNNKSFDDLLRRLTPQEMPEFLILGQCTLSFDASQQATLLQRVCRFIQKCSFDFSVAQGRVDCRAPSCFVSFCLFFWKNKDNTIVVELQRRSGCSVLMQRYRKALVNYLRDGTDFDPNELYACRGEEVAQCVKMMYEQQHPAEATETTTTTDEAPASSSSSTVVGQCHDMMEAELVDQKQMGMENLYLLLNSTAVAPETIHKVANAILWGTTTSGGHSCVLDELSFCLMGNQKRPNAASYAHADDACDFEAMEYAQGHTFGVLHNMALRVLAAALSAAPPEQNPQRTKAMLQSATWRTIWGALCYNIAQAATRPQEAAYSAHCLVLLDQLTMMDNNKNSLMLDWVLEHSNHQIVPCLLGALSFARRHNQALDHELSILLERVQAHM